MFFFTAILADKEEREVEVLNPLEVSCKLLWNLWKCLQGQGNPPQFPFTTTPPPPPTFNTPTPTPQPLSPPLLSVKIKKQSKYGWC